MRVVVFQAFGELFALPVEAVRSVVRTAARRRIPSEVPWVTGVADVRGKVVPLVDLGALFGRGSTGLDGDLLVVEAEGETVAVPVERVVGLEAVEDVAPAPLGTTDAAAGIAIVGARLVVVLKPQALMPGAGDDEPIELLLDAQWVGDPEVFHEDWDAEILRVVPRVVHDLSGVHALRRLREIEIPSRDGTPIDVRAFPRLERMVLRWRPGTVLESPTLRELTLTHYGAKDLRALAAGLPALRSLSLEYGPLERLDGIETLTELHELRLRNLRRLERLDGAERVPVVKVERCPRISAA